MVGISPSSLCSLGAHRSGSQQSTAFPQAGARGVPVSTEQIAGKLNPVGMGRAAHQRMFPQGRVGTTQKRLRLRPAESKNGGIYGQKLLGCMCSKISTEICTRD